MKFEKVLHTIPEYLVPHLGKTMKDVDAYISYQLKSSGFDLTKNQLILLRCISMGVQSQSELSIITNRNKSSLTRLIQSMERKGLVSKKLKDSDKRHQVIEITSRGSQLYEQAIPIVERCFEKLQRGLKQNQIEMAREVLSIMQSNVSNELKTL